MTGERERTPAVRADAPFGDVLRVLQSKEEIRAFYNKLARFYDVLADRSEAPMREKTLRRLNPQRGEWALEIGFGTGTALPKLAQAVGGAGHVFGVDIAERMAEVARERVIAAGLWHRVTLVLGDAAALPFRDSVFDALLMTFTLELFDTPEIPRVLAECRRVLKPGGRLGVLSLSKDGPQGVAIRVFEWTHRHLPNLLDCRPIHVRATIEAAGFRIEHAEIDQMWVPVEIVVARA